MEPERSGAKTGGGSGGTPGVQPVAVVRRAYPKPPGVLTRLVRLCLVPESWAETGRYPFHVTLLPLILAIVLAAGMTGMGEASRAIGRLKAFASSYDAHFPALKLSSDGVLSGSTSWWATQRPIRILPNDAEQIVIDTTGKTKLDDIPTPLAVLITDRQISMRPGLGETPIAEWFGTMLPPKGETATINGVGIKNYLDKSGTGVWLLIFMLSFCMKLILCTLWAALMIFSNWPLAILAARTGNGELVIPRRGAVRFAAAVLVPLLMVDGLLEWMGYPVRDTVGAETTLLLWFLAAAVLTFWTGKMAKSMYGVKVKQGRG